MSNDFIEVLYNRDLKELETILYELPWSNLLDY
jgi:hypothetical protein